MMSDVLVSRCVCLCPCQSPGHSVRPLLSALRGPENTPFPIGISRHAYRAAMYPRKRVSRSGSQGAGLWLYLCQGDYQREAAGRGGGEKHVVYPVMADTRTGRCNSRRQHTYSKTLEKAHGYPSLPYHHTGEYPRTNATHHFSFHRGRTPGCFCPVDPDGQSCPGSCRTRILLTEKVLLPPCNIDAVPHTRVIG